jgi:hypothetical protein
MKINPNIVNDVTCRHANFHNKNLCIVIYTKITKSDKICRFKVYIFRSTHLPFFCSPNYKASELDFLHVGGINSWLQPISFFLIHRSIIYNFLKKVGSLVPMYTKSPLINIVDSFFKD